MNRTLNQPRTPRLAMSDGPPCVQGMRPYAPRSVKAPAGTIFDPPRRRRPRPALLGRRKQARGAAALLDGARPAIRVLPSMQRSNEGGRMRPIRSGPAGLALVVLAVVAAGAQPAAVTTELVRLRTGDGRETAGVVYAPAGRAPRAGVALVHGYGSNFYSGAPGLLAPRLAERGFAAIAVNLRDHDGGPKTTLFEENRFDVQAALDELGRRGVAPLALVAHSLGTNSALYYAAETQDPRVRAVALLAGPGNAFEWNARQFGRERATQVLEEALRWPREGRGKELMLVDLGPLGKALYSADHLVSLRGPQTRSDPYRNIARVGVPVLLVSGGADRLVDAETSRKLRAAAAQAPRAELVEIPGADHAFSRHAAELLAAVEKWLGEVLGH